MSATDTADVLDAAASIIETHGLCQGLLWNRRNFCGDGLDDWQPGTACCITGAIGVARGITTAAAVQEWRWERDPALHAFSAHLGHPEDRTYAIGWNDDSLRKKNGVVRSLREAAHRIRTGELVEA